MCQRIVISSILSLFLLCGGACCYAADDIQHQETNSLTTARCRGFGARSFDESALFSWLATCGRSIGANAFADKSSRSALESKAITCSFVIRHDPQFQCFDIVDPKVIQSSGSQPADDLALALIRKASKLPFCSSSMLADTELLAVFSGHRFSIQVRLNESQFKSPLVREKLEQIWLADCSRRIAVANRRLGKRLPLQSTSVRSIIDADGHLLGSTIVASSGSKIVDDNVLDLVQQAPLAPPPLGLTGRRLLLQFSANHPIVQLKLTGA